MKNSTKNVFIFVIGAGLGAGTAGLALKKIFLNEIDKVSESIRNDYKKQKEAINNEINEVSNKYKPDSSDEIDIEDDEKEEFTRISKDDRTDYTGYSDELKTKKKVNSEVISMEEFTEENGFDKLSFSVFREGMTFINIETNRENKSIAKIITKTILDDNDDVDELYVRNIKEKKDIELIFHDCSYLDWLKEERD